MAGTSNYIQNKAAGLEFNSIAYTYPATIYVALLLCTKGPVARSTAYALGDTVSNITSTGLNKLYKCTVAGTTGSTGGIYPGISNEVISDGTAGFQEQTAALEAGTAQVEPAVGSYARVGVATTATHFTVSAPNVTNATVITFPTPTGAWGTAPAQIWGFATYDALTIGNLLRYGGLTADQIVNTGNSVSAAIGAITFTLDH